MNAIATTLVAILAMGLGASACQSTAPPAGGLGQETKKTANGVATAVAAVEVCANTAMATRSINNDCAVLRAIQDALADCGLNGLSPRRTDSCGGLRPRALAAMPGKGAERFMAGIMVVNLASRAKDCADGKGFCDAMQTVQTLVECGLKPATPDACDQVIAEAKAQWLSAKDGDND